MIQGGVVTCQCYQPTHIRAYVAHSIKVNVQLMMEYGAVLFIFYYMNMFQIILKLKRRDENLTRWSVWSENWQRDV